MYCVIQQVMRKKPNPYGEYREIRAYQNQWSIDNRPHTWSYEYAGGRFERPHLEAYKISIHSSYREGGTVKKRQYPICTMGYYDIAECSLYDCAEGSIKATAEKLGIDPAELYDIIETKLEPLQERIEAEFRQSPEYIARQEHERIIADYLEASSKFCSRYDVEKADYDRCYDVFDVLRNKEYLEQIKKEHKARKAAEQEAYRSYQEYYRSTYSGSSYSASSVSTYSESETAILKQFYRSLSKTYHPDLNPGKDTTAEMQLLNKLKEVWGV